MAIDGNEKAKAQKIIEKIEAGCFDENDVDNFFMRLRAHCSGNEYFKEVADFVAHNDERHKGVSIRSMEALHLSFRFFSEYTGKNKALDIGQPFPMYVKKLLGFQLEKISVEDAGKLFGATRDKVQSQIDNLFKVDKASGTAVLKGRINQKMIFVLDRLLGFITVQPAFTQDALLAQTLGVLRANELGFDEGKITDSFGKVAVCVVALLHNTSFNINAHKPARCEISCEKTGVVRNMPGVNERNEIVVINEDFGPLGVNGVIPFLRDGADVAMSYSLFSTGLPVEQWCDGTLFSNVMKGGFPFYCVDFSGSLGVSADFKLVKNP